VKLKIISTTVRIERNYDNLREMIGYSGGWDARVSII
jgi:hypothetical protein